MSNPTYPTRFISSLFAVGLFVLGIYGITRWIGVNSGSIRDWTIGLLLLWWLIAVVTLPWNLHFKARAVLIDAARSRQDGISVAEGDMRYVARWARLSLWLAIALHVVSAAGLYLLGYFGISRLGYFAAIAALLLMGLRPAGRAYEYLAARLTSIGREVHYPRDDVISLRTHIGDMNESLSKIIDQLDMDKAESWASRIEARIATTMKMIEGMRAEASDERSRNEDAHRLLARDAEAAAARMAEDARVLNHVRELVRFFKEA